MASGSIDGIEVAVSGMHDRGSSYPCLGRDPCLSPCSHPLIARPACKAETSLLVPFHRQSQSLEKAPAGPPISAEVMKNADMPDFCFSLCWPAA